MLTLQARGARGERMNVKNFEGLNGFCEKKI
jgi:hypothetical protein